MSEYRLADTHMHSEFSEDSDTPVEVMLARAEELGQTVVYFTDHYDMDFPDDEFQLDTERYWDRLLDLRAKYRGRLEIRIGVEMGMQPHLGERISAYLEKYPFDYVLGSLHLLEGKDVYYRDLFPDREDPDLFRSYFRETAECLRVTEGIHALGHLDYIVRYGRDHGKSYRPADYAEEIDEILKELVRKEVALELNSGGLKYGLGYPNPHPDVLRRYRELGGRRITFGGDAHVPQYLCHEFEELKRIALANGFDEVTEFVQGQPTNIKICP